MSDSITHTHVPLDELEEIVRAMFEVVGPYPVPHVVVASFMVAILGIAPGLDQEELSRSVESTSEFVALFAEQLMAERAARGEAALTPDINNFPEGLIVQ